MAYGSAAPGETGAVASAVQWLEGTLSGSIATAVAVIAVAAVGFLMLTGRVDVRRAAQVVLGCFILFGASSIAAGLRAAGNGVASAPPFEAAPLRATPAAPPAYPQAAPQPYDPYAGAALTPR